MSLKAYASSRAVAFQMLVLDVHAEVIAYVEAGRTPSFIVEPNTGEPQAYSYLRVVEGSSPEWRLCTHGPSDHFPMPVL